SQSISAMWDAGDENIMGLRAEDITGRLLAGTSIRGVITNGSYTVLYDNNREADMARKVFMRDVLKRALDGEQADSCVDTDSGKAMTVSVPIEYNGEVVGGVYLAENVSSITETISTIRTSLIIFSVLIVFVVGFMSVATSRIITQPISEFIEVAEAISKGDFSRRAKVKGMREVAQMGEALNYMCDELNALDEKRRNFVSDVSHELKTPMAGIKLLCDSLIEADNPDMATVREFLGDMSEEIDRLTRLINKLLVLSRLDAKSGLCISQVDITALAGGVVRSLQKIADEKDILLSSYIEPEIVTDTDYDKLYESVYNIAENAIKYTPERGSVDVSVKRSDGNIVIMVEDTGPGIPDSEKTKVFERFYRLDDSRARDTGGTGLGLAITKEAIQLLGGSIELVDGAGGGSRFIIRLPEKTQEDVKA
ncbi:MAG: HAMP domain-containing histidine kinase, partial [Clostridia bacterium]|nr:HAMP domain-containing histidine kinase [Clostridia bacterium]